MLTHATLIATGYYHHLPCSNQQAHTYQKRFRDANGDTLYFIDIADSYTAFKAEQARVGLSDEWLANNRYGVSVHLYTAEEWDASCQHEVTFGVNAATTIAQIEAKVAAMYTALGCILNPYN